jgi:hypothetical protein
MATLVEKDAAPHRGTEPPTPLKKVVKNFDEDGASLRVLGANGDRLRSCGGPQALY